MADKRQDRAQEERSEDGLPDLGENIDSSTFQQILEMDEEDDDTREFSRSIVYGFFEQAESTFLKMDEYLAARNLEELSSLGHFLKGSSATLGLTKVKDSCEKIQHFGAKKDESGVHDVPDDDVCLERIKTTLAEVRREYDDVHKTLEKFYET